jgi:SAM-dependent methyltransferase
VDFATNLLEQARQRAASERLEVNFEEGDAERLPFAEAQFDIVMSMFGAMFPPRPEIVAAELARVCRPGGRIAMANWTPEGFIGQVFKVGARYIPPPEGVPPPALWGIEDVARKRLGPYASEIQFTKRMAEFNFPFPPAAVVEFFREYFGPIKIAFSRLDASQHPAYAADLEELWRENNEATGDETLVRAEYLEVVAVRA